MPRRGSDDATGAEAGGLVSMRVEQLRAKDDRTSEKDRQIEAATARSSARMGRGKAIGGPSIGFALRVVNSDSAIVGNTRGQSPVTRIETLFCPRKGVR